MKNPLYFPLKTGSLGDRGDTVQTYRIPLVGCTDKTNILIVLTRIVDVRIKVIIICIVNTLGVWVSVRLTDECL